MDFNNKESIRQFALEDFQNRFTDIRELVNMDIEVDDKEEYI